MGMEQWKWRQAAAKDEPLLLRLFVENKAAEFAPLRLSAEQQEPLLLMQYRARLQSYAQSYPAAVNTMLCLESGEAVGRHLVERQADCYRGIDLAILAEYRNRGLGAWALRQIQQAAELEGIPFYLRVLRSNPALHLYERQGFIKAGGDALSFEMVWQSSVMRSAQSASAQQVALADGAGMDRSSVLKNIFLFLREIGIAVEEMPVPLGLPVPGVQLQNGGLRVDQEALLYPGDLLHMAGRLAVMKPSSRVQEFPAPEGPAEEMAALAWSYAAAIHIGLPPEVVFHSHGYRGQSYALLQGYRGGRGVGAPMLGWLGMTTVAAQGRLSIYPQMLCWLRKADVCEIPM